MSRRLPAAVVLILAACAAPASAAGPPEASSAGDGPAVAEADPFTLTAPGLKAGQIELTTVSTRPTLVSGPDVRVEVRGLQDDDALTVARDGADVSSAFTPVAGRAGVSEGVVGGLKAGPNALKATASDARYGTRTVTLRVLDHRLQGSVISGPQQTPFACETEKAGLGKATDADCVVPAQVHWFANVNSKFQKLDDPYAAYPSGTATTTVNGKSVPFVVRVQSEVVNRSITRIAVLDDPHARGPDKPFVPPTWNRRLLYQFGESCGTGYHQGVNQETDVFGSPADIGGENIAGPFLDLSGHLGQGWMVAVSTLTILGVHCNPLLSAETMMMVKERIVDDYGSIAHVVSAGASGGAIQQYTTANNYPGLLDAVTPLLSFPDVISTAMTVGDCLGLIPIFAADTNRWNAAKQNAVTGLATPQVCQDWQSLFGDNLKPTSCDSSIPQADRYDAKTNPKGVRCDLQDDGKNVYGVDPATGFGNRPLDNTGVQYGLIALQSGLITPDDFVELNHDIGGFDVDGNKIPQRHAMSPALAARMYETGQVTGRGALDQVPIIDQSIPAVDFTPEVDIHDQVRPFEQRARLDGTFGGHGNQAIWSGAALPASAIDVSEEWLNAIDALQRQHPDTPRAQLVTQARPSDAADKCQVGTVGVPTFCEQGVDRHAGTRQEAGGPLAEDHVKCQLKPIDAKDYPATMTADQLAQLRTAFPDGVCDFSKPPVGWSARSTTWLTFGDATTADPPVAVPYPIARSGKAGPACVRKRAGVVSIRPPRGGRLVRVRIAVTGHKARTVKGRRLRHRLRVRLPAGRATVRVRVTAVTAQGRRRVTTHVYRACRRATHRTRRRTRT